jgi:hypothetical protein
MRGRLAIEGRESVRREEVREYVARMESEGHGERERLDRNSELGKASGMEERRGRCIRSGSVTGVRQGRVELASAWR